MSILIDSIGLSEQEVIPGIGHEVQGSWQLSNSQQSNKLFSERVKQNQHFDRVIWSE